MTLAIHKNESVLRLKISTSDRAQKVTLLLRNVKVSVFPEALFCREVVVTCPTAKCKTYNK